MFDIIALVKAYSDDGPIIIKWGRYIPNRPSRYDEILGVTLASDNQYGKQIS